MKNTKSGIIDPPITSLREKNTSTRSTMLRCSRLFKTTASMAGLSKQLLAVGIYIYIKVLFVE